MPKAPPGWLLRCSTARRAMAGHAVGPRAKAKGERRLDCRPRWSVVNGQEETNGNATKIVLLGSRDAADYSARLRLATEAGQ
jgi:hypothetical protein